MSKDLGDFNQRSKEELVDYIEKLRTEIAQLEARLEIDPRHPYDGIACRDVTIREQEKDIKRLCRQLAASELDAKTAWGRYENANSSRITTERQLEQANGRIAELERENADLKTARSTPCAPSA